MDNLSAPMDTWNEIAKRAQSEPSAVWALSESMKTMGGSEAQFAVNFMLRFLIHLVGDLHQPLHSATLFANDTRFGSILDKSGDRGGNNFRLKTHWGKDIPNLHTLWDAAGGMYMTQWPYSEDETQQLLQNATKLMSTHPKSSFLQYQVSDAVACLTHSTGFCSSTFEKWAQESHGIAKTYSYGYGITPGSSPSKEYLNMMQVVSQQQITLAGYRLADLLQEIVPHLPQVSSSTPAPLHAATQQIDHLVIYLFLDAFLIQSALMMYFYLSRYLRRLSVLKKTKQQHLNVCPQVGV